MYRGYIFRLYPNNNQKQLIDKSLGVTRFIYNYFLDLNIKKYQETKKIYSYYDLSRMIPQLNNEYPFLKEVDSCIIRTSLMNLTDSYQNFFKGKGLPNFKKKGIKDSFKTSNNVSTYKGRTYNSIELDLINRKVKLPKLGLIDIKGYRNLKKINGKIKSSVVRKISDRYYVSILVEENILIPSIVHKTIVGIDLGIKDMVITSEGIKLNNPNKERLERLKKRLKGLSKKLSRSKKNSKNRYKLIIKIQRLYQKMNNLKKHLINELANTITKENDIIVLENLDIKKMYQEHKIARKLVDIPLYKLIETIKWKSKLRNKKVIQIDRYYASSRICNRCDYKNNEVKDLKIRKWECPKCGSIHDRDINASINIMFRGLEKYMKEQYV